jgi:hypothetical protein
VSPAPWQETVRRLREAAPGWAGQRLPEPAELTERFGSDREGVLLALAHLVAEGCVRRTLAGTHYGTPMPGIDAPVAVTRVEPAGDGTWRVRWQDRRRRGGTVHARGSFPFTGGVVEAWLPGTEPPIVVAIDGAAQPPVVVAVTDADRVALHAARLPHLKIHRLARGVRGGDGEAIELALAVIGSGALAALGGDDPAPASPPGA